MFFQKEKNKKQIKEIYTIGVCTAIFFVIFLLLKLKYISLYTGLILLILSYVVINFNLTKLFFQKKRSKLKIYIAIILDVLFFFLGAFSLKNMITFFVALFMLYYFLLQDEGKAEAPKIINFILIYIVLKVVFSLILMML